MAGDVLPPLHHHHYPLNDLVPVLHAASLSPRSYPFEPHPSKTLTLIADPQTLRSAHSANTNFDNCPTSHADGNAATFVKCMTWQMGQDGLNAGKYGTVDNSFVRVIDDSIKPWDSHGIYTNVTIWQQPLGWPINFG